MYNEDEEHTENEFYYPTEDFTHPVTNRNEVVGRKNTTKDQTSLTSLVHCREIQTFIKSQRLDSTKKKTTYDINVVKRYFESINETREIENIPAKKLNNVNILLAKFFMNASKKMAMYMNQLLSRISREVCRNI